MAWRVALLAVLLSAGLLAVLLSAGLLAPVRATAQSAGSDSPFCGLGPSDWCAAPPGDLCGRHRDVRACKADPHCVGMPYRGESVVACRPGERGFSPNCPTVGCRSASSGAP